MALDLDSSEFGVGDFHTLWIFVFVQFGAHCDSGSRGSRGDQLNDGLEAAQGFSSPIEGDKGKQAMLDLVPLAGAGRQVGNRNRDMQLIGQQL